MFRKNAGRDGNLFTHFLHRRKNLKRITPEELGHAVLLGVGEMRQDYFYGGEYRLVDLYGVTDASSLRRFFCECFLLRLFAAYVGCVTYPSLRSQDRWKPVISEMFKSFYEYVEKEPTRVFFEVMGVQDIEQLKQQIVEPRWELYRKEYNRKGNRGFHVATLFGVFFRSRPDLADSGAEHAKDFNTKRGVVMAIRFNQMLQAVEKTLNQVFVTESRLERIRRVFFSEKIFRPERFRDPSKKSHNLS